MYSSASVRQRALLAVAVATLAAPSTGWAQLRTEITPFVASYYGITHLAQGDVGPFVGNKFTIDQKNAIAFGGRLTVPIGAQIAVQGEFAFTPSGASATEKDAFGAGTDGGFSEDGNIIFGSVRAVFSPRRSNLFLLAGPAIVKRGGDAWKGIDSGDITDFGGVVGLGFRANVTPRFRINFTAEAYLYSFDAFPGAGTDAEFQADVLVGLGVPIFLGR